MKVILLLLLLLPASLAAEDEISVEYLAAPENELLWFVESWHQLPPRLSSGAVRLFFPPATRERRAPDGEPRSGLGAVAAMGPSGEGRVGPRRATATAAGTRGPIFVTCSGTSLPKARGSGS